MGVLGKSVTAFLIFFFLSAVPSTAEMKSIKIQSDNRPVILFQKFGFTNTGNITVVVSSVSVTSTLSIPDASLLGFFLLSEQSLIDVLSELQQNPNFCLLDSKFISLLFTFKDLSPPPQSSFNRSYPVTYGAGEYSLFFVNCNHESFVTMDVRTELFNTDDKATNNYLSVGLTQLPSLYFIFSLFYLCFLGFWISVCFNNQRSVHKVHILMGVLLTMKALSLFCAAEDKQYVKVTGMPHGWNVLFYIFQFISSVLFFAVIVLIGAGWLYLKPNLVGKEKMVLMIVITLQVLANVASIVIGETGPFIEDWVTWNQVFLLADFVCGCAAIFPIVWSIRSFSRTDAKAARNLALFRLFCVVVVGYMLVTNIGVFALKTVTVYKQQWVDSATEEIASLVFCLVLFYMFRPVRESEYLVLDDEGVYEEAPKMVKG
ncbi:putative transmembrane protein GPR107/GPR108 [Helianthus debilis subsp. tardiflorus]